MKPKMKTKLCRIYDAGLSGFYIEWGYSRKRENFVSVFPSLIGNVFASDYGYLVFEGTRGDFDVVSVWKTRKEAEQRLWERYEEAWRSDPGA